jgi:hypothetical protein
MKYKNERTGSYLPGTYTNNLDIVLAKPLGEGQGGQIEVNFEGVYRYQARLRGKMYSFLASEIQKAIGQEAAEDLLRKAVLRYGRYRGEFIRRRLEKAGLPCDIEHLKKWWDHPSDKPARPDEFTKTTDDLIDLQPHWTGYSTNHCTIYDGFSSVCPEVEKLIVAYCEEVHRGVSIEVNPEIEVWYPALLPRGQGKCIWRYTMPKESALKAKEIAMTYREEAKKDERGKDILEFGTQAPYRYDATTAECYEAEAARLVYFYHFILDYLIRQDGFNIAFGIAKEALRRWGENRGQEMREDHIRRGWELNVENFIKYHDDPSAGDAWVAENVVLTPEEHTRIVTKSLYADKFDEVGSGKLGILFEEESIKSQVAAYNPSIEVTIPRLIERGDKVSEFRFKLK